MEDSKAQPFEQAPGEASTKAHPTMYIDHRLPLSYGRGLSSEPRGLTIPTDPVAALAFAQCKDREADLMLSEGKFEMAERLSHAALEARARATGCRA